MPDREVQTFRDLPYYEYASCCPAKALDVRQLARYCMGCHQTAGSRGRQE